MLNFKISTAYILLAAAFMVGCGGPAHKYDAVVTGTVTVDGELAKSGTVIFHPAKEDGQVAIGKIFADGSYSLRTGQGDLSDVDGGTVKSGDYIVTVSVTGPPAQGAVVAAGGPPMPGPSLIAQKYALKGSSDLRRKVVPGPNVLVLDLEAAEPESSEQQSEAAAASDADAAQSSATAGPVEATDAEKSAGDSKPNETTSKGATTSEPAKESAEAVER